MEILEKGNNIIKKKFNTELIYSKQYLKAGKMNTKGGNAPVILIDSIYRKYEIILSFF